MRTVYQEGSVRVMEFSPDALHLFGLGIGRHTVFTAARFLLELRYGYRIEYLFVDGSVKASCFVGGGSNPRYFFCGREDLMLGPYYVPPEARGHGYAAMLLEIILRKMGLSYVCAYDYIERGNKASEETTRRAGGREVMRVSIHPLTRRMKPDPRGAYSVYRMDGGSEDQHA